MYSLASIHQETDVFWVGFCFEQQNLEDRILSIYIKKTFEGINIQW